MKVSELRKKMGMSQSEFAGHFGIPVRTIQEWEQQRCIPHSYVIDMMYRIWELEKELEKRSAAGIEKE